MRGQSRKFRRRERLGDFRHRAQRVAVPLAVAPRRQLPFKIWGRLPGQRRIAGIAFAGDAMTAGAGRQAAPRIAFAIEALCGGQLAAGRRAGGGRGGQGGVVSGDLLLLDGIEQSDDRRHPRMRALAPGVEAELSLQVTAVEPGEARGQVAVALALQSVAADAGVGGPRAAAAERDQFAALAEGVPADRLGRAGRGRGEKADGGKADHAVPTVRRRAGSSLAIAAAAAALSACKPAPDARWTVDPDAAARGKAAIERAGCAACHQVPGLRWPQGQSGPSLMHFRDTGLIAGQLPNRPDILAAFIRNAPAVKPGTTMPAMPVSETEAREIAAYLYEAGDD